MFGALGVTVTPQLAQATWQAGLILTCQKVAERGVVMDQASCKARADQLYKQGMLLDKVVDTIVMENTPGAMEAAAGRNWLIWGGIGAVALIGIVLLVKK